MDQSPEDRLTAKVYAPEELEKPLRPVDTRREGRPIDPRVLSETAVIALRCSQIDERSQRCFHIAGRQQAVRALNEVPRPHEMIAAFSLGVSFGLSPGNR